MKLSTKGRYGLRAMMELALKYGSSPVLMSTISKSQGISPKYLHSLMTSIKSAGLIKAVRGTGGGYTLARDPAEIRLDEILRATEGPFSLINCIADEKTCGRSRKCAARDLWKDLGQMIEQRLASVTLAEMVSRQAEKLADPNFYCI